MVELKIDSVKSLILCNSIPNINSSCNISPLVVKHLMQGDWQSLVSL
jgi:hypothetical protein